MAVMRGTAVSVRSNLFITVRTVIYSRLPLAAATCIIIYSIMSTIYEFLLCTFQIVHLWTHACFNLFLFYFYSLSKLVTYFDLCLSIFIDLNLYQHASVLDHVSRLRTRDVSESRKWNPISIIYLHTAQAAELFRSNQTTWTALCACLFDSKMSL